MLISKSFRRIRRMRRKAKSLAASAALLTAAFTYFGVPGESPAAPSILGPWSSSPVSATPHSEAPPAAESGDQYAEALATLATLPIKGRAPKTGYSRDQFGPAWSDNVTVEGGHDGCPTREDQMRQHLTDVVIKPGTNGCVVLSGTLYDPYSGTTVPFQRGRETSSLIQLDHLVPLLESWQKGSQGWDSDKRRNFANDPANLQLTIGSLNMQKKAGDIATWLPPNKSYRCTYVARIVGVKATYGLWVTQAEHDAMSDILTKCPSANP